MLRRIVKSFFVSVFALVALYADAEVHVARTFTTDVFQQSVNIGAGQYWALPLPAGIPGDRFEVDVATANAVWRDISAYVVDEENLARLRAGMQFRGQGKTKGVTPFKFDATRPSAQQIYLVLDNRYAALITKKATVAVRMTGHLSEEEANEAESSAEVRYRQLKAIFVFRDFDINLVPCGNVNAFSRSDTGDITLCTELLTGTQVSPR